MAVYTRIPETDLIECLGRYTLGHFKGIKDILSGVENSNFLLSTDAGKSILTIYEKRVRENELPFFIHLMQHLAFKNIPCPAPIADKNGKVIQRLCNKPAALVSFLNGAMTHAITPQHCQQVGNILARIHIATHDFKESRPNNLSLEGWAALITRCLEKGSAVAPELSYTLIQELKFLVEQWPAPTSMPFGVIHADLFPDNVFFEHDTLCGVIDFYFACSDFLAYDLAISINAWCFDDAHAFIPERAQAMVDGYQSVRLLNGNEKTVLPVLLRGAALRFLLTRLYDKLNHPEGAVVVVKDPEEYIKKLTFFQSHAHDW